MALQSNNKKGIAILGSTGSIGTQALDVVKSHPGLFDVIVLSAENNSKMLIEQAKQFKPDSVVIGNESKYQEVSDALINEPIKVYAGIDEKLFYIGDSGESAIECLCNGDELKEIPEFLPEESEAAGIVYAKENLTRLKAEKSVGIIGL